MLKAAEIKSHADGTDGNKRAEKNALDYREKQNPANDEP